MKSQMELFQIFMVLVFLVGGIVIWKLVKRFLNQRNAADAIWKRIAKEYGLNHNINKPGITGALEDDRMYGNIDSRGYAVEVYHTQRPFPVFTGSETKYLLKQDYYTRFRGAYKQNLDLGLAIYAKTPLFSAVDQAFGGQDIEIGYAEFDQKYVVKGRHQNQTRSHLTEHRMEAIIMLLNLYCDATITDNLVEVTVPGRFCDYATFDEYMKRFVYAVQTLDKS